MTIGTDSETDRRANLNEFLESTTFHGVKYVFFSRRWWVRLIWGLLVIAAWTGFLLQAYKSISRFISFPTSTTITVESPESLEFPAITACNFNYFVNSSITDNLVRSALSKVSFIDRPEFTDEDKAILDFNLFGWETLTETAGIQADDFILECSWKLCFGLPCCGYRNFTKVITPMGNCFTFYGKDMFVSRGGPSGGLTIVLNIQLDEYFWCGF